MALIHSKQLNPKLTGSFTISGSNPLSVIGGLTTDFINVSNHITASGEAKITGRIIAQNDVSASGDLFLTGNADIDGTSNFAGDVVLQNNLSLGGHITASGNISASGTVFASKFESAGASNEVISFNDNLDITGHITGSGNLKIAGNISGSGTSTGSFGKIELTKGTSLNNAGFAISGSSISTASFGKIKVHDDTHLNSNGFAISGSSASTASFGMVKIHAIAGNSPITFTDTIIENQNIEVVGHITSSGNIKTTGNIVAEGDITAQRLIVSSSVTNLIIAEKSGSTTFGDDIGDTHRFTGSLVVTGSLNLENGRIFEQGSSVIDHATAMAIVFGG